MSALPAVLLAALAVLLSGCIAAPVYRDASFVTPKDPPRLPQRKPPPPANFAAWAEPVETAAAPAAEATVTVEPLAPLKAAATPAAPRQQAPQQPATVQAAKLPTAPPAPVAPSRYRVAKGDSLYGIARRFGLPVRAVIDANALEPPYRLNLGQELTIPQAEVHEVAKGDTIFNIARRYEVDRSELVRLNGIEAPYTIPLGQKLILPQPGSRVEATAIASAPQVRAAGQGGQATPSAQAAPTPAQSQVAAVPRPPLVKPKSPPVAKAAVTTPGVLRKPPARTQSTFLWPVRGPVLSSFGRKKSGVHNDGINIVAPRGTPVRAAENGVVAYAGEELKGFGRLLLIKHADGWITAYAHNEKLLVTRGDVVKRGQTIARVGSSGSVDRPQLHFEVRRGTRAVNPETMMGPRPNTAAKAS